MPRHLPIILPCLTSVLLSGCRGDAAEEALAVLQPTILADGDTLVEPGQIAVVDDRLVVLDRSAPMVHVLRLADGSIAGSFGRSGEGPGEFRSAWHVERDPAAADAFWIYDITLRRLTRLQFGGEEMPEIREIVNLKDAPGVLMHPAWLSDTRLIAAGVFPQFPEGRLIMTDREGRAIRMLGRTPSHPGAEAIPTTVLQHAYEGPVTVRPDRSRFAIATRHADRLEIFSADGAEVAEVAGSSGFLPRFETRTRAAGVSMAIGDDLRAGYVDLDSTDEHVFALFSGARMGEAGRDTFYGRQVHVFDWAGNVIARLELPVPVLTLAVTPDGRRLFVAQHDPEPAIVSFDVPAQVLRD